MKKAMSKENDIRWGWLKFMYVYTIIGAGGLGVGILAMPGIIKAIFRWPAEEPVSLGIVGSVYAGLAILSVFGLRDPLKFAPILALQLCSKILWLAGVVVPLSLSGRFPLYAIVFIVIFATYIIGDLVAIPFSYIFAKAGTSYGGEQVGEVSAQSGDFTNVS